MRELTQFVLENHKFCEENHKNHCNLHKKNVSRFLFKKGQRVVDDNVIFEEFRSKKHMISADIILGYQND